MKKSFFFGTYTNYRAHSIKKKPIPDTSLVNFDSIIRSTYLNTKKSFLFRYEGVNLDV